MTTRRLPLSSAPPFNLGPLPDEPHEINVRKVAAFVPMSDEMVADAAEIRDGLHWLFNATPEEIEARQAELSQARAAERATYERRPLDLARVLDGLGWSMEYAEHFVQPYCTCSDSYDGWDYCAHARDEGFVDGAHTEGSVDAHAPAASTLAAGATPGGGS